MLWTHDYSIYILDRVTSIAIRRLFPEAVYAPLAKMSNHWLKWILVEIVQTL